MRVKRAVRTRFCTIVGVKRYLPILLRFLHVMNRETFYKFIVSIKNNSRYLLVKGWLYFSSKIYINLYLVTLIINYLNYFRLFNFGDRSNCIIYFSVFQIVIYLFFRSPFPLSQFKSIKSAKEKISTS